MSLTPPFRRRRAAAAGVAALLALALACLPGSHARAAFAAAGSLPGLGGGRIWDVAVDPALPSTILAGTDAGAYVSRDSGVTWRLTLPGVRVWSVGFDIRSPQTALAGTDGSGVYLSGDAGSTWDGTSLGLANRDVRCLAFGLDGIAAGTDSGVSLSPDGRSWHSGGLGGLSIAALAVAANSPQLVLVAGADDGDLSHGYVFRSSGSGWAALTSGLPSGAVASSLSAGPIDAAIPRRPLVITTSKGTFRSGDSGDTWTPSAGLPQTQTVTTATFSPLDPDLVYAGADAASSSGGDLWRSTDSGMTFGAADAGLPTPHRNVEVIAVAPTTPPTVVAALDPPGSASIYTETDSSAPVPPALVPEAPGQPVTAAVPTAAATPRPATAAPPPQPQHASPNPVLQFAGRALGWPTPLVFEVGLLLLALYVLIRWREHTYIEGPP